MRLHKRNKKAGLLVAVIGVMASLIILLNRHPLDANALDANGCPVITDGARTMWHEASMNGGEARYELAKDLVSCGYFVGMKRNEILKIFGPSERDLIPNHWSYVLGVEHDSNYKIDYDWVSLEFADDVVVSAKIHPD